MFDGVIEWQLKYIVGTNSFNDVVKILTMNPGEDSNLSTVWTFACNIHDTIIVPVAIMFMFVFFLIALVDKLTGENFTWEQLWRQMVMLLVSYFFIDHALDLMALFYSMGIIFVEDINAFIKSPDSGFTEGENSFYEQAKTLLDEYIANLFGDNIVGNFFAGFIVMLFMFVPFLFTWGCRVVILIICYTRLIELFLRTIFAPIALSDFFLHGFQGAGWRYLKNYVAVCLQGAILLTISLLFSALLSAAAPSEGGTDLFGYIGLVLAFTFSGAALMFKSLSFAKELMGTA